MLCPTPLDKLLDAQGRPTFLWDNDLTLDEFKALLASEDDEVRRYWLARLLEQARPDDARTLVSLPTLCADWEAVQPGVGRNREFWAWRVRRWREHGD